jgi:hypothetical protein
MHRACGNAVASQTRLKAQLALSPHSLADVARTHAVTVAAIGPHEVKKG